MFHRHRAPSGHRAFYAFAALWLIAAPAGAQISLSGQVMDAEHAAVAYANVQVLAFADSAFVQGTIAEEDGSFLLGPIRPGEYRLFVSLIGYEDHVSERLSLDEAGRHEAGIVVLHRAVLEMDEVSVEARRVLYEQKGDRLVINVANAISLSGKTALEVLERAPGVIVNQQAGTISLVGKDGVQIMIDGKRSYVPAAGLMQLLAGISADNLDSIELITSPSANLDAEGNAGFINIVMKERLDSGLSGSAAVSGGYGDGEIGSASFSADYRRGRIALNVAYTASVNRQMQYVSQYRRIENGSGVVETPTLSTRDPMQRNHNARLAIDYELDERTTIGGLLGAYDNRWTMDALNEALVRTNGQPSYSVSSLNDEINHWRHALGNVYVDHKLTEVSKLRADVDYVYYHDDNPTTYLNSTRDAASAETSEAQFESKKLTPIRFIVAKADYQWTRLKNVDLDAGVKAAFSQLTNETSFEGLIRDEWIDAAGLVSKSTLEENIAATYGMATVQVADSTSLKLGLRYEHTDSELTSETGSALVDRRYGSLFPSVSVSHKLSSSRQIDASYSRRITRPSFTDIAPFLYFLDPATFLTGNTSLQAATINTVKVDATIGDLFASAQYAWEDKSIARFQSRILAEENVQIFFSQNLTRTRAATFLAAMPLYPTRWWSAQNNAMVIWQEVTGLQDQVHRKSSRTSLRFSSTHTLSLPHGFDVEASGLYQSATYFGLMRFGRMWRVDLALRKVLPRNYGNLTLAANDVFDSNEWNLRMGSPHEPSYFEGRWDLWQPSVQLTYSVRFGGTEARSRRSTASAEEQGRVG